ncbi:DUF397 domain-containing protein [Streptomyces sp. NPDC048566]|uniref:DUF397 domain-containing protein n=1 Tax=Streptomyces sp. NPDC048566 TaxID=3365569 RepID=UPI003714BE06
MHRDAQDGAAVVAQEDAEVPSGRHGVHEGVGRELAGAEQHVVGPPRTGRSPAGTVTAVHLRDAENPAEPGLRVSARAWAAFTAAR